MNRRKRCRWRPNNWRSSVHRSRPTFPPRGKSAENRWQSRFSRNRAPPHRRHGFAARKIHAIRFATSLPQDLSAQLMFELAGFGRRGLSRSLGLEFCVDRCGARAVRRRGCRASASRDAGFRALTSLAAFDAAQALPASRLFVSSTYCADANRLRFAATRLRFAARLVDSKLSATPQFGPPTLSPSIDVRFRALDDPARIEIPPLNPPQSSPGRAPSPAHAPPARSARETAPPAGRRPSSDAPASPPCRRAAR